MAEYYNWTLHGEDIVQDYYEAPSIPQVLEESTSAGHEGVIIHSGVMNNVWIGRRECSYIYDGDGLYDYDESGLADRFTTAVHAADQPLWDGCKQSQLGIVAELVDIKANGDYYRTKKLVKDLSIPVEKIHACKNGCMLYWKGNVDLEYCKFCGDEEQCNVRLGLCTDGFAPHSQYGRTYSCWLVIITLYNLFPGMCMSSEYIFLTMLWHVGVRTYDHATDRAFMMWAALMWTANDLSAYRMASGWRTAGVMGCPVCMDDTRTFHLQHDEYEDSGGDDETDDEEYEAT
ncbi:UNVERIFIED_CONTAM: hypothetical protein Scaly_0480600 [Sesamum calycinum]|uniref:Uncharacterized protein n=1 Tax=Sesamum calycinum TaxID=2727403 RepID=A0AAW2SFA0_9LAMI